MTRKVLFKLKCSDDYQIGRLVKDKNFTLGYRIDYRVANKGEWWWSSTSISLVDSICRI